MIIQHYTLSGLEARPIEIEITPAQRAGLCVLGLPEPRDRELSVRLRAALQASNLSPMPATVRFNAPSHSVAQDLPIALALAQQAMPEGLFALGELAPSGELRPVRGVLPMALAAQRAGFTAILCPEDNAREAGEVPGLRVLPAVSLREAICLMYETVLPRALPREVASAAPSAVDLRHVRGQHLARRALEIAAAGGHSLLMVGPPGAGKTLLARALLGVLPPLSAEERLEVSQVYSVAGLLLRGGRVLSRPFRAPHHTVSAAAILGGGPGLPRPGEVSLAHGGVLFLDELPEFDRSIYEVLRQPMASGEAVIARSSGSVRFPARFQLIAAASLCPCGYLGADRCQCSAAVVARYQERAAALPFDLRVVVQPVPREQFLGEGEPSAAVARRVAAARARRGEAGPVDAGTMALCERLGALPGCSSATLARAQRVARTIADLAGEAAVQRQHMAEALVFCGGASA